MFENIAPILPELWVATGQTFLMLAIGLSAAVLIGGPLGILLFLHASLPESQLLYVVVAAIVVIGAVMSARLALQAHTPAEVYTGFLLGLVIGLSIWLIML